MSPHSFVGRCWLDTMAAPLDDRKVSEIMIVAFRSAKARTFAERL